MRLINAPGRSASAAVVWLIPGIGINQLDHKVPKYLGAYSLGLKCLFSQYKCASTWAFTTIASAICLSTVVRFPLWLLRPGLLPIPFPMRWSSSSTETLTFSTCEMASCSTRSSSRTNKSFSALMGWLTERVDLLSAKIDRTEIRAAAEYV